MLRFLFVILLGILSGFILGPVCMGILYILRPLLDRWRALAHRESSRSGFGLPQVSVTPADQMCIPSVGREMSARPTSAVAQQALQLFLDDSMSNLWQSSAQVRLDNCRWRLVCAPSELARTQEALLRSMQLSGNLGELSNIIEFVRDKTFNLNFQERPGNLYTEALRWKRVESNVEMQRELLAKLATPTQAAFLKAPPAASPTRMRGIRASRVWGLAWR
jgi:hypothetical protein